MIGYDGMIRRIKSFWKDPLSSSLRRLNNVYYEWILRNQYPETYRIIREIIQGNALYGGSYKYVHLHRLLAAFKPRTILEFGSGSSTGVFAVYARKSGARVCTTEDNLVWQENTKRALGELVIHVEFLLTSSVGEKGFPNRCYYVFKTDKIFDLVYVDGPPLIINGQADGSAVNWNIVDMIYKGLGPQYIIIDGRISTVRYIATNFLKDYTPCLREEGRRFPGYRYHSYFIRRYNNDCSFTGTFLQ